MRGLRASIWAALLLALPAVPVSAAPADEFRAFLGREIWPEARAAGVSRQVFDAAFDGVTPDLDLPDLQLPGDKVKVEEVNRQAEFGSPASYFDENKIAGIAAKGRRLMAENRATLARIEKRYGVPAGIVVAIWGRESGFGAAKIPYNAFRVLGTKAWASRRKAMFRGELIALLKIAQDGDLPISALRSSWAGALGQPQFMPSKFRELAVDFDGDGARDIWTSVPDTLASIAHYLAEAGWQRGRDWGFEAAVPASVSCTGEGPDHGQPIVDLAEAGVTRASGKPFPAGETRLAGHLLMPAGRQGPVFVATPNFYVLKSYNNSDLYALFIGHLADRMNGGGPFRASWGPATGLTRGDVSRMQETLQKKGYDVGGTDGLAGFKTRRSIGAYQEKAGMAATCWPSRGLAKRLG